MSIKKALMHYFDKATNGMISFHPETESACVTDWHTGIMNSLASKTLGTVVSSLTTDSVFGKLMSLLLSASGVKYSLGTNGYVKFGSFFGGLIIQWGITTDNGSGKDYWSQSFPLSMISAYSISLVRRSGTYVYVPKVISLTGTGFTWTDMDANNNHGSGDPMSYIVTGN